MLVEVFFAYATYFCALSCVIFCILRPTWLSRIKQLLMFIAFAFAFYLLESWAEMRTPFYKYSADFPHQLDVFCFSCIASILADWDLTSLAGLMGPGPSAAHPCAYNPMPDKIPLCVPVGAASIAFCVFWTVRYLKGHAGFATAPFVPVTAPLIVGLVTLWLDLSFEVVLTSKADCMTGTNYPGLGLWHWHTSTDLADFWFHIPLYNFGVWLAGPAVLASAAILAQWLYLKYFTTTTVLNEDLALRFVMLIGTLLIFAVSPNAPTSPLGVYLLVAIAVIVCIAAFLYEWPGFIRNNTPWQWLLILPLVFYFSFPVVGFFFAFTPVMDHIWLLVMTIVIATWGIFIAISPYTKVTIPGLALLPFWMVIMLLLIVIVLLAYIANA